MPWWRKSTAVGKPLDGFIALCDREVGDLLARHGFTPVPGDPPTEDPAGAGASRAYRNGERYVKVSATTDYRDGAGVSVVVGEGSLEWPEVDWNGIALWQLAGSRPFRKTPGAFALRAIAELREVLGRAAADLDEHARDFLEGDLERLRDARRRLTKRRAPYQVHAPGPDGRYHSADDPESAALKERFERE